MASKCNFLEVKRSSRLTARAINVNEKGNRILHDNSKSTYLIDMKLSESILIGMVVNWLDFGVSTLKFEKMVGCEKFV